MNYEQGLPPDIYQLPSYSLPSHIFTYTIMVLLTFLFLLLALLVVWIYRVYKRIHNTDYLIDYVINYEFMKTKKQIQTHKAISQQGDSGINIDELDDHHYWSRIQSRILEFFCLSIVVAINICTYTCNLVEMVAFILSVLLFGIFNVFRAEEKRTLIRVLWLIPMLVCYLPFYLFDKNLSTS